MCMSKQNDVDVGALNQFCCGELRDLGKDVFG